MSTTATVTVSVAFDFTGMAESFRQAAAAVDAMQASLTPAPLAATVDEHADDAGIPSEDPQGP